MLHSKQGILRLLMCFWWLCASFFALKFGHVYTNIPVFMSPIFLSRPDVDLARPRRLVFFFVVSILIVCLSPVLADRALLGVVASGVPLAIALAMATTTNND